MYIFLTWYLLGMIGASIINHYEVIDIDEKIQKNIENMSDINNQSAYSIGSVPKFWHGLLASLAGVIIFLMALHSIYVHRKC